MFDGSRLVLVEKPAWRCCRADGAFIKLARVVTEMPASEAAAERAISIFCSSSTRRGCRRTSVLSRPS
jgi:hypothetical protein